MGLTHNPVEQHYNKHVEGEWGRLQRHRTEFAVTLRALRDYLPPAPATILDVGSGPGRYAIALSQQGYGVTLVDLSQANLAMAQQQAAAVGVTFTAVLHGDATQLPTLAGAQYDVVLLLGPLYHLITAVARQQALQEAHRVLKPNGLLCAAFITRFAPVRDTAINYPELLLEQPERFAEMLEQGINRARPDGLFTDAYFARPEEIRPLVENNGFNMLNLIGCEGIAAGHEERLNQLDGELWQAWVELNYRLGQEPSLYGAADHLLAIARKV